MKIRVTIGYTDFIFEDINEAASFADTAAKHINDEDKCRIKLTIDYGEDE